MKKLFLTVLIVVLMTLAFSQNVTISFFQESLTQALSDLAAQENITIITDSTVGGFITLTLNNVPISEALNLMLLPGGYSWKEIKPGIYFVGTADPTSNSFLYLASSTPYHLRYVSAQTVLSFLPSVMKRYIFTSSDSPYTILIGAPDVVKKAIIDIVKKVDVPTKEILIQMTVVEADESVVKRWGMDLQCSQGGGTSTSTTFNLLNNVVNLVYKVNDLSVLSDIKAESASGAVKILATPKIRVESGKTGKVDVFTTRKYLYTNSDGKKVYANVNVGVNITVTPTISASGDITLNMSETVSGALKTVNPLPDTLEHTLSTTFNTKVGQTVAVGGVSFNTYEKSISKVPILSDIPVIGYLFTKEGMHQVKKEIMIIVTCEKAGEWQ